ncbi:endonuclease/exonuclease/phosphatase family protein [Neolewinella antarctica]|uniref:Endonuclease/exonuclease/phosphatase (EEP) superfamily protein YafD n=1 Tax=Neolewinella antarctica TaxID=442734 RepID=A0ABX0X9I7_9BACT|nr:endonuclease/exonuclease/phosphatase family protein [Neolewinella antarctica]NJC25852.1 endonuclease/exonuclease/phosphatase (EEP) superfamily protein YafD [Neolewinella antarctica]
MEKLRKAIYLILCVITVLVMLASVLSVFRNTPNRYLKMLDFPRIQFFITSLVTMILFIIMTKHWRWYDYALVVGLLGGIFINGRYLINYTPLVSPRVPSAEGVVAEQDEVSLLLANVLRENRDAQPIIDFVREKDPDFVVAMEVNAWWDEHLRPIEEQYPYVQEKINEVGYGMSLYSKFPLLDVEVTELNNEKVPSFEARVRLANGREIILHTVHPVPPKLFEKLPDNKGQDEVALLKIGDKVANSELPNIVAGDLNDVVWGFTNTLVGTEENILHDVRVGRSILSTFDATKWYMRWPIDHVFVTKEFSVVELERGPDIGSDHFPIYVRLALTE